MKYGSVCSGIEAATVAWKPLGWSASFFSEIDAFPRAVLEYHYPEVPLHGDFTTIQDGDYDAIDLLVGGTPCQSFSVAGLRKGLDDPRGNLMLGYGSLAQRLRPTWLVWENVPGVLSANRGRDFGTFLGMLAELGYGFAYRVLDAQYFGVAQRRRRVFVVGYLGDWRPPAAVLFERHSLSGHPAPSREAREETTGTLSSRTSGGGGLGTDFDCAGGLQPVPILEPGARTGKSTTDQRAGLGVGSCGDPMFTLQAGKQHGVACFGGGRVSGEIETAACLTARGQRIDFEVETFAVHGTQDPIVSEKAHTLGRNNGQENAICFDTTQITSQTNRSNPQPGDPCHPLAAGAHPPAVTGIAVRRLTPVECERLQGFPDNYTLIPTAKARAIEEDYFAYLLTHRPDLTREQAIRLSKDGPRYKAIGNSMAVPVMEWIGNRIELVSETLFEKRNAA